MKKKVIVLNSKVTATNKWVVATSPLKVSQLKHSAGRFPIGPTLETELETTNA